MGRDPLARMDVDTRWAYHRKCRALQAAHPNDWPAYWCAYMAVLGESWAGGDRVSIREAWVPSLPVSMSAASDALYDAGLLDKSGKVPAKSWDEWFGPAAARIESLKARGRKGAETRWSKHEKADSGHRPSDGTAMAQPSPSNGQRMHHASQPTTPTTPASQPPQAPAFDVMLLVENLTRAPFNYREGHRVHDTLVADVANHGADVVSDAYRTFRERQGGPVDAAQIVFGVHNALHPLVKPSETDARRREDETEAQWQRRTEATRRANADMREAMGYSR